MAQTAKNLPAIQETWAQSCSEQPKAGLNYSHSLHLHLAVHLLLCFKKSSFISRLTDIENKLMFTRAGRGGVIQEWGVGRYRLLGIRQAQERIMQHRECSQHSVITVTFKHYFKNI